MSVTHLVRSVMDRAYLYDDAVDLLKSTHVSAPVYYTVSGKMPPPPPAQLLTMQV
jgi:hypothetical protein